MGDRVMRAKMQVASVTRLTSCEVLEMSAVAAKAYPADGADEDNSFARWSPQATLKIHVANPALFGQINPGDKFYVDFIKAE